MAWPTPLESDALDRRRRRLSWVICLEAAICFAGPILMLLVGTAFAGIRLWQFRATLLLGWCGIAGVARVLVVLCTRAPYDRYARLTMLGLGCGVAVALYLLWSAVRVGEVFLARRALFH